MICPCYECTCGRPEVPESEEHELTFKRHRISVTKDSPSTNWYIQVTHPNGCKVYDGWWLNSETATPKEAIEEAKQGAMLIGRSKAKEETP